MGEKLASKETGGKRHQPMVTGRLGVVAFAMGAMPLAAAFNLELIMMRAGQGTAGGIPAAA